MNLSEYEVMRSVEEDHWWYRGLRAILRRLAPPFDPGSSPVILDAGCGTGANLKLLRSLVPNAHLIGLDVSPEALRHIAPAENLRLSCGNVNRLDLPDETVDLIVATDLLGQNGVDVPEAVRHFCRVLKPGGVLMINVPAFKWLRGEHDLAVHVTRRFEIQDLRSELQNARFQDVRCRFWNGALLLPLFLHRFSSRLRRTGGKRVRSDLNLDFGFTNRLLGWWMDLETAIAAGPGLPIGSSIFGTARKPPIP